MARVYRISTGRVNVTWEEALQLFLYRKKAQGLCAETLSDYRIHANRFLNAIQIAGKPNGWGLPNLKNFSGLRDYALMLVTMDIGIRPKEALSLRIEHLDLMHRTINIPAEFDKTRRGRTLPISPCNGRSFKSINPG